MANVTVVGAGAWGTALAIQAARSGHAVTMWALEPDVVDDIEKRNENSVYLPKTKLPATIRATTDAKRAVADAELVILVPPSKHLRSVSSSLADALPKKAVIAVASKGIEESSLKMMSEVLEETLPSVGDERRVFVGGPSFAREVADGLPTDIVVASKDESAAVRVQSLLHAPNFRIYTSVDPAGIEIGGALKNVMAIATGACDGLRFGANARSAIITRGLAEMARLGVAVGADPLTFLGLAGMGDLVLTCTGDLSRNRTLGLKVAEGMNPHDYLKAQRSVAEGYFTCHAAHDLGQKLGVDMPITDQVYSVLHAGRPLRDAIVILMTRASRDELRGIRV
ncbi:MAG: NAD(P)H-dependent glycerol-3-phosphate dehydrogenase [Polyangiaceae bacterium]